MHLFHTNILNKSPKQRRSALVISICEVYDRHSLLCTSLWMEFQPLQTKLIYNKAEAIISSVFYYHYLFTFRFSLHVTDALHHSPHIFMILENEIISDLTLHFVTTLDIVNGSLVDSLNSLCDSVGNAKHGSFLPSVLTRLWNMNINMRLASSTESLKMWNLFNGWLVAPLSIPIIIIINTVSWWFGRLQLYGPEI